GSASLAALARKVESQPADLSAKPKPVLQRPNGEHDASVQADASEEKTTGSGFVPPKPPDKDALRMETRLVNLNVKALDKAGRPISDLKQEDFAIVEDGVPQEVAFFQPVTAPINLVLLM